MNNTKITTHRSSDPFIGKTFKIVTYRGGKELTSREIKIESRSELETTLEEIKRFNNAQEELFKPGNNPGWYHLGSPLVQKLITGQ